MATSASLRAESAGWRTIFSCSKSTLPSTRPIGGMTTCATRLVTILPNAAPMITPTARSMTLPRAMNSRNSLSMVTGASAAAANLGFGTDTVNDLAAVEPRAQLLAGLEERHVLGPHLHRLAGARIAPGPGRPRADREGAEAAQLHPAAALEGLDHPVEDHAHHPLDVALGQVRIFGRQRRDQF